MIVLLQNWVSVVIGYGTTQKKDLLCCWFGYLQRFRTEMLFQLNKLQGSCWSYNITMVSECKMCLSEVLIIKSKFKPPICVDENSTLTWRFSKPTQCHKPKDIEAISVLKDASASAIYGLGLPMGSFDYDQKGLNPEKPKLSNSKRFNICTYWICGCTDRRWVSLCYYWNCWLYFQTWFGHTDWQAIFTSKHLVDTTYPFILFIWCTCKNFCGPTMKDSNWRPPEQRAL